MSDIILDQKKKFLDALADTYDKTEGTVLNDLATANAISNEHFYIEWANLKDSLDYRVATGSDLTTLALNFGIYRKEASYAEGYVTFNGTAGTTIPKSFVVANDTVEYTTDAPALLDATGAVTTLVTATVAGTVGNTPANTIVNIPISMVGLNSVTNGLSFSDAQNEETDKDLRDRIDYSLRYPATSGNANHYFQWASEVSGVGGVRVIVKPLGAGSMKIAIVDTNNDTAQTPLIDSVYNHIIEHRPATSGVLEVVSATPLNIDVAVTGVTIDNTSGLGTQEVLDAIIANITVYVNSFAMDATEVPYVGVVKVVIQTDGVANYTGLTLNGSNASVPIVGIEIPKANSITATV